MGEMLAEAGRIAGPVTEISGEIIFGLQPSGTKLTGQKPIRFVAPVSQMADLSEGDLIIVRFSRADRSTVAGPVPVTSLSRA
ncbi:MAG: hypothetical protein ACLPUO_06810 [Streptosporangiaceae bacterium]|jgi:hypothetical protein